MRQRILDAAQQMFADYSYDAVSLRAITIRAKVNIAAPHYYFGSKVKLFGEVYRECMEPVNRERLRRLDDCEQAAAGGGAPLEEVVRAYVEPYLRLLENEGPHSTTARFLSRALTEQNPLLRELGLATMDPIWLRFSPAIRRGLPGVPEATVYWRFYFMMSALYNLSRGQQWFASRTQGLCSLSNVDEVIDELVQFVVGGLRAAVAERLDSVKPTAKDGIRQG